MAVGITIAANNVIRPDRNPERTTSSKVSTASFGDGYEHRLGIGYNSFTQEFSVSFINRAVSTIEALEDFLIEKNGISNFPYTYLKGTNSDGTPKEETVSVVCSEWEIVHRGNNVGSLRCTLRRVFE